jgi:hypothetical protein
MNENALFLQVNAEEHELINYLLTRMLDDAYELYGTIHESQENPKVQMINNLREKSFKLWMERFDG